MANSSTLSGKLDSQDFFFPNFLNNRNTTIISDEFTLETTAFGQPLTLSLVADDPNTYDTLLLVRDANTGALLRTNDNGEGTGSNSLIGNQLTLQEGVNYRVFVTSLDSVDPRNKNAYT